MSLKVYLPLYSLLFRKITIAILLQAICFIYRGDEVSTRRHIAIAAYLCAVRIAYMHRISNTFRRILVVMCLHTE